MRKIYFLGFCLIMLLSLNSVMAANSNGSPIYGHIFKVDISKFSGYGDTFIYPITCETCIKTSNIGQHTTYTFLLEYFVPSVTQQNMLGVHTSNGECFWIFEIPFIIKKDGEVEVSGTFEPKFYGGKANCKKPGLLDVSTSGDLTKMLSVVPASII